MPTMMSGLRGPPIFRELLCLIFIFCTMRCLRGVSILGVHPRMSLFLWKVAWRHLPTRSFLISRGQHLPSSCPACGEGKTLVHVLFLCPRACQVWHLAGLDGLFIQAEDLVYTLLELLRHSIGDHRVRALRISAAYIIYHIWLIEMLLFFTLEDVRPGLFMKRAHVHADEILIVTAMITET